MARVPFQKPALNVADQLAILVARGLIVADSEEAEHYLANIGYYRLSGYTLPFQRGGDGGNRHDFWPGTTFEAILERYVFDRKLRLVVMDAVERIEVSIRADLSNSIAVRHGPNWYQDPTLFNKNISHAKIIDDIKKQIGHDPQHNHRRHTFIRHYYNKYNAPDMPPSWMVFEAISFGKISFLFKALDQQQCIYTCNKFGMRHKVLCSWFHGISYIRNLCAHHSRLWNRICTIKPLVAKTYKSDLDPNTRVYAHLVVMQILLDKIALDNHWANRLSQLLDDHPNIPIKYMGFPEDWRDRAVWKLE